MTFFKTLLSALFLLCCSSMGAQVIIDDYNDCDAQNPLFNSNSIMGNAQFNEFQLQLPECVLLYQGNGQQAITEAQYMPVDLLGPPQMLDDIPMEGSFFLDYPGQGNPNAFLKLVVFDPQPTEVFVLPLDQPFTGQQTFQ